jgi:hypothetical protein
VHTRASFVLAAAGVAAGALAQTGRHGAAAVIALFAFFAAGGFAVATLVPRWQTWSFQHNARRMLETYVDGGHTFLQSQRWIAEDNRDAYEQNRNRLARLYLWLWCGALLIVVGIFMVALDLAID